jgi:signal transduction histidine kinase
MLDDFIAQHRDEIISSTQQRIRVRRCPKPTALELTDAIPLFVDALVAALRLTRTSDVVDHDKIGAVAARHGRDLVGRGLTVAQLVHDYGDVCQAITELAVTRSAAITSLEFGALNLCLDDAIAEAVTAYAALRERTITDEGTERLGVLAHELRNVVNVATLSFDSILGGSVTVTGRTGQLHVRSLMQLRDLLDRSLADVRLDAGITRHERFAVSEFLEEVEIGAVLQAKARGVDVSIGRVEAAVAIEGDRQILSAALMNLIQNAFKFTPKGGSVSLTTRVVDGRVLFDVEDECGGLPPGKIAGLFQPFEQRGHDRTGVGLGLAICRRAAVANHGEVRALDRPGKGCVFTLDLPLRTLLGSRDPAEGFDDAPWSAAQSSH